MLPVTRKRWPWSIIGSPIAASSLLAIDASPAAPASPSTMTTNSSPPRRATRSFSRTASRRRCAIALSSSSPALWPSVSLIVLKRSRSMK